LALIVFECATWTSGFTPIISAIIIVSIC
jgi:hypothetical protein